MTLKKIKNWKATTTKKSEAKNAEVEAGANYTENLAKVNNESGYTGYTTQQSFNVNKTDFYWKKMPCRLL